MHLPTPANTPITHVFEWTPAGAATGLGSMPQADARCALSALAGSCADVPFWPQLPQRSAREGMLDQSVGPLMRHLAPRRDGAPGFHVRPGAMDGLLADLHEAPAAFYADRASGFFAFERAAQRGAFDRALALKAQVTGPVTLATAIVRGGARQHAAPRPLADHAALLRAVARYVRRQAHWQAWRLARFGRPVLVFVDEPVLAHMHELVPGADRDAAHEAVDHVLDGIRIGGALAGLHCCGGLKREWFATPRPDVLSFDAHQHLDTEALCAGGGARTFIETGGILAFGLVPTSRDLHALRAEQLFVRWLQAASMLVDLRTVAQRSMVSPTCGLARFEPDDAARALKLTQQLSHTLRQVARGHIAVGSAGGG